MPGCKIPKIPRVSSMGVLLRLDSTEYGRTPDEKRRLDERENRQRPFSDSSASPDMPDIDLALRSVHSAL